MLKIQSMLTSVAAFAFQVTFVITGACRGEDVTSENYMVYHNIAAASSGQVCVVGKTDVEKVKCCGLPCFL